MASAPLLLFNGFSFTLPAFFLIVFEDCKPVQEEVAKASGNDHPVNSDPEPDSCANEDEKSPANTEHGASGGKIGCQSGTRIKLLTEAFLTEVSALSFSFGYQSLLMLFSLPNL